MIDIDNLIKESIKEGEEGVITNKASFDKIKFQLRIDKAVNSNSITDEGKKSIRGLKRRPSLLVAVLTIILTLGITIGISAKEMRRTDKIDYPFVDDQGVIGKWQSVDLLKEAGNFVPDKKSFKGTLYLQEMAFINGGKVLTSNIEGNGNMAPSSFNWTKGMVINPQSKTASSYTIKDINGVTYMFFEWKNGDYTLRGIDPIYYALKKVDSNDYSGYTPVKKTDKTDYSFENDSVAIGEWKAVDFVTEKEKFDSDNLSNISDLYLKKLVFEKEGSLKSTVTKLNFFSSTQSLIWTKGLVLDKNNQTASKYEIKEIKGGTYMFYEWKSGDYIYRGLQPKYYVLKKVK